MYDTIIIGSGPAGLMCANALQGTNYILLEKNATPGKKLLLTGGGRCNVTNRKENRDFLDAVEYNKKFLYSTIARFGPYDIIDFLGDKVPLLEVDENQMFPVSNKADDVLQRLLETTRDNIVYNQAVTQILPQDDHFIINTKNSSYTSKNVVLASGGCSFPKTGSSGDHLRFANELDISVVEVFPAETGICLKEKHNLSGIHFENVEISFSKVKKDGHFIFTHRGISGNAAMKISEFVYLQKPREIFVDFLPHVDEETIRQEISENKEKQPISILSKYLTKRFSEYIVEKSNIGSTTKNKQLIHRQIDEIISLVKKHSFLVKGVEELISAYATGGGISLKEINSKTMEVKKHPGLYVIGEALDIHGPIGGYNITLAMSSGYSAGMAILEK